MTEPGAGSDLRGIKTTAKKTEGGYIVNGAKTFISSGKTADIIVTFVKTGEGNKADAFSLLILENGMEGFDHGKKLHKMGSHGHDTAELSFSDVFVPEENLISGKEGQGFIQLMMNLPLERLSIGIAAGVRVAGRPQLDRRLHEGPRSVRRADHRLPEHPLQSGGHRDDGRRHVGVPRPRAAAVQGRQASAEEAAKVKFWTTDREWEILDRGVQLHGGYGYITEYPIAKAFLDARVHRIYGGTNEIMREIVGRQIAGKR